MAGLTGKSIASAYKSLLRIDDDTNGVDTGLEAVTDGEGTKSSLLLSDDAVSVRPNNDDTTVAFGVRAKGGTTLLKVDTTNSVVKAGVGSFNVLNQYAYFGVNYGDFSASAANTHYPIPFSAASGGISLSNDVDFGTGTDPDDTFTTANTDTQYASQIVPMMWFVPDNISIDSVTSIEGADNATGDTTRMHLKSFTLNSGSTSCLTAGELLAHNSDVTNAGNEQAYKSSWTVDEPSVTGGKVILAFMRSDSVNSDYSVNITVKYHLV
jgi:hypothetical protein